MKVKQTGAILLLLIVAGFTPCYAQTKFFLSGYAKKMNNGDSLFLSYKENGKHVLKSTVVANKKFSFAGSIKHPVKAYISRNENPATAYFITESIDVFIEPGKIKITSPDSLTGAVISGTASNEKWQLFREQQSELYKRRRAIKDPEFFTEAEKKDTALVNYNTKEIEKLFYEDADARLAFANKHPDSYVSLDMLYNLSRINTYIFKVEKVYNNLADNLKQTEQGNAISERIKKKKQLVPGMKAIAFTMQDHQGNTTSLSSFTGKYVLLDFWASWCVPCREEHPNLINMYKNYAGKDFTIISISIDTDKEKWTNAIDKDKLTWTQLSDLKGDKGETYLKYGITSIPANFLIDPNGIVIAKDLKGNSLISELEKLFSKMKDNNR